MFVLLHADNLIMIVLYKINSMIYNSYICNNSYTFPSWDINLTLRTAGKQTSTHKHTHTLCISDKATTVVIVKNLF